MQELQRKLYTTHIMNFTYLYQLIWCSKMNIQRLDRAYIQALSTVSQFIERKLSIFAHFKVLAYADTE